MSPPFSELAPDENLSDDKPLPWEDRTRVYRALHTKQGRNLQICFIPNGGTHDRYLPLADLRLIDPAKDGSEIILEFSSMQVVITGRFLRRAADTIASGRCIGVEVFDATRRDAPTEPTTPYVEAIGFCPLKREDARRTAARAKPRLVKQDAQT